MKRERRLAVITMLIILAAAVAGVFLAPHVGPPAVLTPAVADRRHEGNEEIRPQVVSDRSWENTGFVFMRELGCAPGATMADPIGVRVDSMGAVYVLDWGARCVRKFSPSGDQLMVFGGQAGHGPGEFSNLTDMDIDADGTVWACDPANGLVTVFAQDGTVRTTLRPGRPPLRLALLGGGAFMLMPSPSGKYLFHRYDGQGDVVDTCGTVVRDQEMMSVILDGRCAGSHDGRFAYAGYRAGILGLYNVHRTPPLFFARTLEHPGLPEVVTQQAGDVRYVRVAPDAPLVSRSISIVGHEVHVLSGTLSPEDKGIMDVYDLDTGAYERSYQIPVQALAACRTEGMLYAVVDTTVKIWSITHVPSLHAGLQ